MRQGLTLNEGAPVSRASSRLDGRSKPLKAHVHVPKVTQPTKFTHAPFLYSHADICGNAIQRRDSKSLPCSFRLKKVRRRRVTSSLKVLNCNLLGRQCDLVTGTHLSYVRNSFMDHALGLQATVLDRLVPVLHFKDCEKKNSFYSLSKRFATSRVTNRIHTQLHNQEVRFSSLCIGLERMRQHGPVLTAHARSPRMLASFTHSVSSSPAEITRRSKLTTSLGYGSPRCNLFYDACHGKAFPLLLLFFFLQSNCDRANLHSDSISLTETALYTLFFLFILETLFCQVRVLTKFVLTRHKHKMLQDFLVVFQLK